MAYSTKAIANDCGRAKTTVAAYIKRNDIKPELVENGTKYYSTAVYNQVLKYYNNLTADTKSESSTEQRKMILNQLDELTNLTRRIVALMTNSRQEERKKQHKNSLDLIDKNYYDFNNNAHRQSTFILLEKGADQYSPALKQWLGRIGYFSTTALEAQGTSAWKHEVYITQNNLLNPLLDTLANACGGKGSAKKDRENFNSATDKVKKQLFANLENWLATKDPAFKKLLQIRHQEALQKRQNEQAKAMQKQLAARARARSKQHDAGLEF